MEIDEDGEDGSNIDSDVSDTDLLELQEELKKLGSEKTQRDLAAAAIAAQEITQQK